MRTTWMARGLCAAVLTLVVVGFTAADDKDKKGGPPGGFPGGDKKGGFGPGKGFPPFGGKDFKKDFDPSKGASGGAFGKGPASVDLTQVSPETAVKILALVREDAGKKGGGEKKGTAEKKDDKVAPKTITIDLNKLPPDVARMIERAAEKGKDEKKEGDDKGRGRGKGPFGRPPE